MDLIISIITILVGVSAQLYVYHRVQCKSIKEVKEELLLLRTNDLKHINSMLGQITDHVFQLAKKD